MSKTQLQPGMTSSIELGTTILPQVKWDLPTDIRRATMEDIDQMYALIKYWAERGHMLVRTHQHLYENLRDFFVAQDSEGNIVGTGALHILWHDIAEVRGLAIHPDRQGQGLGRWLTLAAEREAKDLGIPQIFAWTLQDKFFTKQGYHITTREHLPPRVFEECSSCPFYDNCREIGVTKVLNPEMAHKPNF